jgi:hypothetical protein
MPKAAGMLALLYARRGSEAAAVLGRLTEDKARWRRWAAEVRASPAMSPGRPPRPLFFTRTDENGLVTPPALLVFVQI